MYRGLPRIVAFSIALLAPCASAQDQKASPDGDAAMKKAMEEAFRIRTDPNGHTYFPKGRESYYTKYLSAMKEPSLFERGTDPPDFEFRFTWLRSFHDPIAIRIWKAKDGHRMRVVRLAHQNDHSPDRIVVDITRELKKDEWQTLEKTMDVPSLQKPLSDAEDYAAMVGNDGAMWIYETCANQKYQVLEFWCLKEYGPKHYEFLHNPKQVRDTAALLQFSLQLLKLANLKIPAHELY